MWYLARIVVVYKIRRESLRCSLLVFVSLVISLLMYIEW